MNRKVLFLCTGNSCHSQMAEVIVNLRLGDIWEAVSERTEPVYSMDGQTQIPNWIGLHRSPASSQLRYQASSRFLSSARAYSASSWASFAPSFAPSSWGSRGWQLPPRYRLQSRQAVLPGDSPSCLTEIFPYQLCLSSVTILP
jgi:hypothetical protein